MSPKRKNEGEIEGRKETKMNGWREREAEGTVTFAPLLSFSQKWSERTKWGKWMDHQSERFSLSLSLSLYYYSFRCPSCIHVRDPKRSDGSVSDMASLLYFHWVTLLYRLPLNLRRRRLSDLKLKERRPKQQKKPKEEREVAKEREAKEKEEMTICSLLLAEPSVASCSGLQFMGPSLRSPCLLSSFLSFSSIPTFFSMSCVS